MAAFEGVGDGDGGLGSEGAGWDLHDGVEVEGRDGRGRLEIPAPVAAGFTRFLRVVFVTRPEDAVGGLGGMFKLRGS